jgi:hypothetical protein
MFTKISAYWFERGVEKFPQRFFFIILNVILCSKATRLYPDPFQPFLHDFRITVHYPAFYSIDIIVM